MPSVPPYVKPSHDRKRKGLRMLGISLMILGGGLAAVGFIDFFRSFDTFGPPRYFWMAFVGLPMFGVGTKIAGFGYLGTITRYGAGEVAPVAKDALRYLREEGHTEADLTSCRSCGTRNRPDAKFCDDCGAALGRACASCGTMNDRDSRFCDNCGSKLQTP